MTKTNTNNAAIAQYPTLSEAKTAGAAWLAASPAAIEIEYTVQISARMTMRVWVQRDGSAFNKSQFA